MAGNRRAAIKKIKKLLITAKMDVDIFRNELEDTFTKLHLPNNVENRTFAYGNIICNVLIPEIAATNKMMIYIHGGSFAGGSKESYRDFCASLSNVCSCRIVLPDFRLAPSHPFPASLDDVHSVFKSIYNELKAAKMFGTECKIIIAADSTGASIACGLVQRLSEEEKKSISNVILFSPILDFSQDAQKELSKKFKDEVISVDNIHRCADIYTYSSNYDNPQISVLKADNEMLKNFPPVYIQIGAKELLINQSLAFKTKLEEAGSSCIVDIWDNMMFMFQIADEHIEESHRALEKIGKFLNQKNTETKVQIQEREQILQKNNIR